MQPINSPDLELLAVETGSPAKVISERTRCTGAELLFLGPHRHRRGLIFENTLRSMLSQARIPVWIQPQPARAIRSVLAPIDFSALSRASLAKAQALSRELGAKLTVAHVFEPPTLSATSSMGMPEPHLIIDELRDRTRKEFHAELQRLGIADEALLLEGDPVEAIEAVAPRFDLIVLGSHGRSALGAAFLGSVTQALARHPATALLVIPPVSGNPGML
jgi:nucleotide-binding universal stress UspA family protein